MAGLVVGAVAAMTAEAIATRMLALSLDKRIARVQWMWEAAGSKKREKKNWGGSLPGHS
jgi:hypothetical protein